MSGLQEKNFSVGYWRQRSKFKRQVFSPELQRRNLKAKYDDLQAQADAAFKEYIEFDYCKNYEIYKRELQKLEKTVLTSSDFNDFLNIDSDL